MTHIEMVAQHNAKCEATKANLSNKEGPWMIEPHWLQFEEHGLACMVLRNSAVFHLNGYVAVPEGHPLYGIPYQQPAPILQARLDKLRSIPLDQIDLTMPRIIALLGWKEITPTPDIVLSCHGGITYADTSDDSLLEVPKTQWVFGFDCEHLHDYAPALAPLTSGFDRDAVYRDIDYVMSECKYLAQQLKEIGDA